MALRAMIEPGHEADLPPDIKPATVKNKPALIHADP